MQAKYLTTSPSQTKKLGENLAKEILKRPLRKKALRLRSGQALRLRSGQAFVIALEGDLGGGKTTFLQGFAKGLGIKEKILSPTFVLMKRFNNFYHIDCYRVKNPKAILDLGFEKIIAEPKNIVAIEWADRIKEILPKDSLIIKFDFLSKEKRCVKVNSL